MQLDLHVGDDGPQGAASAQMGLWQTPRLIFSPRCYKETVKNWHTGKPVHVSSRWALFFFLEAVLCAFNPAEDGLYLLYPSLFVCQNILKLFVHPPIHFSPLIHFRVRAGVSNLSVGGSPQREVTHRKAPDWI